jgi:hypothetical protein
LCFKRENIFIHLAKQAPNWLPSQYLSILEKEWNAEKTIHLFGYNLHTICENGYFYGNDYSPTKNSSYS